MGMLETCTRLWRGGTVVPHRTPQADTKRMCITCGDGLDKSVAGQVF